MSSNRIASGETSILDRIVAAKRRRIEDDVSTIPLHRMVRLAEDANRHSPPLDFEHAIGTSSTISVIAEMKRSSPSAGEMDAALDPPKRAQLYCNGGAAAISVLTESDFFRGSIQDLETAAQVAHRHGTAVLEKDFVVDEYQVHQARAHGADTVLLIVAILDPVEYAEFYRVATELGMEPLVEVFDVEELDVAMTQAEPRIVGINNRNLKTLETSLDVFVDLASRIPDNVVKVAESGMKSADDVRRMADAGARAVLVGESLMTSDGDPSELIAQMAEITVW